MNNVVQIDDYRPAPELTADELLEMLEQASKSLVESIARMHCVQARNAGIEVVYNDYDPVELPKERAWYAAEVGRQGLTVV